MHLKTESWIVTRKVIFESVKIRGHIVGSNYTISPLSSAGNYVRR